MGQDDLMGSLAGTPWQVAVIGAGPAGCVAAGILAGAGRRVLLVEKSPWPREKVCGGCLNHSAMQTLRKAGMGGALGGGTPARSGDLAVRRAGDGRADADRRGHTAVGIRCGAGGGGGGAGVCVCLRRFGDDFAWARRRTGAIGPATAGRAIGDGIGGSGFGLRWDWGDER